MGRDPGLQRAIDSVAKRFYGRTNTEALKDQICVDCGKPATEFKDRISKQDYLITGLCQQCQDDMYE